MQITYEKKLELDSEVKRANFGDVVVVVAAALRTHQLRRLSPQQLQQLLPLRLRVELREGDHGAAAPDPPALLIISASKAELRWNKREGGRWGKSWSHA